MCHSYFLEHKPPPSNPFHLTRYDRYVIVSSCAYPFWPLFFCYLLRSYAVERKMVVSSSIFGKSHLCQLSLSSCDFLAVPLLLTVAISALFRLFICIFIFASEHLLWDYKNLQLLRRTVSKLTLSPLLWDPSKSSLLLLKILCKMFLWNC